jgi:hypothetical protein
VTSASEVYNDVVAGTSLSQSYLEGVDFTTGDIIRVRITNVNGTFAYQEFENTSQATSAGWSMSVSQQPCSIYNGWGIDGSTLITKFNADYINDEIDIIIGSDFEVREIGAWWKYNLYTESGIRDFFEGITFDDEANIKVNTSLVSIYLDNTTPTNVSQIDNRRFYRDDNVRPVKSPTTGGGGIDIEWRSSVFVANIENIPTTDQIATAVWDKSTSEHTTDGTFGKLQEKQLIEMSNNQKLVIATRKR